MTAAVSSNSRRSNPTILNPPSDPTERAVTLLREALALLAVESFQDARPRLPNSPGRLIRLPEVQRLMGLGRSAIYQQMQRGTFHAASTFPVL